MFGVNRRIMKKLLLLEVYFILKTFGSSSFFEINSMLLFLVL